MGGTALFSLLVIVFGGVALVLADFTGALDVSDGRSASLVALLAIGVWVGSGFIGRYKGQGSEFFRHLAIWLSIVTLITAVYVWKQPLKDMLGIP